MSFERIGPYTLNKTDLIAASIVISFKLGSRSIRVRSWILVVAIAIMIVGGGMLGEWIFGMAGLLATLYLFTVAPALRSRAGVTDILLNADVEGVIAENRGTRTVYKWPALRPSTTVGSRLFIMISENCALVVPRRATTEGNFAAFIFLLASHGVV